MNKSERMGVFAVVPSTLPSLFILALAAATLLSGALAAAEKDSSQQTMDVLEGENVLLECRFDPNIVSLKPRFFWIRSNRDGHDNVAIGTDPLENNYSVEYEAEKGRYDLRIGNATYNRDNGRYECRMKKEGSGKQLHSKSVDLTVLLKPSAPTISPSATTATEGHPFNLSCSSVGGSPPPQIYWYRDQQAQLLDATLIKGQNKDDPTVSVLSIVPTKENDGANYRCTVWNRALGQNQKLEASTEIFVNYFPRISVGPENPLKVEKDETAHLECSVDAKPAVTSVKWMRNGRFVDVSFKRTIPRVGLDDAGSYVCSADNGLGQVGKAELNLDVLYGPVITLSPEKREVKEGEDVEVECKVAANPRPAKIEWSKAGDPSFVFSGATLRLTRVTAADNGRYICSATNFVQPSGKERSSRIGNATVEINIRHRPGKTLIEPEKPVAVDGKSVTLTCGAVPPGYPTPKYSWWRDDDDSKTLLSEDSQLTIDSVTLASAGKYHCQPENDLGDGSVASAVLDVYQAPKIITQLQPTVMKREGDAGFLVSCSAVGKPKPEIKWFKDGRQISEDTNVYQVTTVEEQGFNLQSTLKYVGAERIEGAQLMPGDRGQYRCEFENEVGKDETIMLLRIEHAPVVVHQHNRVAFDLGETATIPCRMQAFPDPRFEWSFENGVLQNNAAANTTNLGDDVFESAIRVFSVGESSYGDYTCKAMNKIGQKKTIVKLQPKGKPDRPSNIRPVQASYSGITLAWDEGFDGGYNNTLFTVQYRKQQGENSPRYHDCRHHNPCNITGLEQHTQYYVTVKASNIRGESKFSEEVAVATKIDVAMIPKPENVHYEKSTGKASFQLEETAQMMPLVAKIELENSDGTWSHHGGFPMGDSTFGEMALKDSVVVSNLRVRLCLESNELLCGPYAEALIVDVRPDATTSSTTLGAPWLIAVVVCIIVLALLALLIAIRCFCCGGKRKKGKTMEDSRPNIMQPPPYTTTFESGIENKGVDSVKDVSDDNIKANLYYNGHYSAAAAAAAEQSNSNSANGGSVNSQDSLWNVKNNAAAESYTGYQNGYMQYDAMAMQQQQQQQQQQGYSEDYTHYPYPDEYLGRVSYGGDQYASVNKQGRSRLESDYSPYGDVSGLPDPYTNGGLDPLQQQQGYPPHQHHHHHHNNNGGQMQQQQQPQQHYDDSVAESGYSTPTSKNRRIIREIIV